MEFMSLVVTGLSIASILLLVALGLAIIYGVTGVINLAHGELVMIGAYCAWALQSFFGIGLLASLPLIFLVTALLGWIIDRVVIRHLYNRPLDDSCHLGHRRDGAAGDPAPGRRRAALCGDAGSNEPSGISARRRGPIFRIFILGLAVALFAFTWYLIFRTSLGLKLRAITQSREIASCFGINSSRIYGLTFAYGAGLAGLAGAVVSPLKSVAPEMGTTYVVDAFMVVVLGGVESLIGSVASAFIIGQSSSAVAFYANDTIAKALVLLFIVILIRFRPQGLFAAKVRS